MQGAFPPRLLLKVVVAGVTAELLCRATGAPGICERAGEIAKPVIASAVMTEFVKGRSS